MKAHVETTHALSLPGVMGHLYWAAFPKKIISRKDAKPQRGGYVQISGISPMFFHNC
jgi:hypothetical protein